MTFILRITARITASSILCTDTTKDRAEAFSGTFLLDLEEAVLALLPSVGFNSCLTTLLSLLESLKLRDISPLRPSPRAMESGVGKYGTRSANAGSE